MATVFLHQLLNNKKLYNLPGSATVKTAVDMMVAGGVGGVMVIENDTLKGIFTERDLLKRVVGAGLDPSKTTLEQVMTKKPYTLTPNDKVVDAVTVMQEHGFRHVPIIDKTNNQVAGMVSIRDLYATLKERLELDLQQCEAYVLGDKYGGV